MEISVIIPVYNCQKYLSSCLDSLLNQKFTDFEIIAVDDGSKDSSLEVLNKYSKKFTKFTILEQNHKGSAAARNLALKSVNSKYVTFVDADDYVNEYFLKYLYDAIEANDCDLAQCGIKKTKKLNYSDDNIEYEFKIIEKNKFLKDFCSSTHSVDLCSLCNKIYRSELFDDLKFNENKLYDDEHLIHKVYYQSNRFAVISAKLYYYYMSKNSQMRAQTTLNILDSLDAVECQIQFFEKNNELRYAKLLQLKYYITLFSVFKTIKEKFPSETKIINDLSVKSKGWKKALFIKGCKLSDKVYLIKIALSV